MIVNQDKLLNVIDATGIMTFPRSVILFGPRGSGKSLIARYCYDKLHKYITELKYVELDCSDKNTFNAEFIMSLYCETTPMVIKMNARDMGVRGRLYPQELLLKVIEEPPQNLFFIIEMDSEGQLYDTIVNRCQIWKLNSYSEDILKQFGTNILYCKTPGDVIALKDINPEDINRLVNLMIDKLYISSYASILTIPDKFIDDNKKWNVPLFNFFMKTLDSKFSEYSIKDYRYTSAYELTHDFIEKYTSQPHCIIERVFKKYLFELKQVLHDITGT